MRAREPITADDLDAATTSVVDALRPGVDRDWLAPAHGLDWTCRVTAEHTSQCLLAYAAQLAVQPQAQYVRFVTRAEYEASPTDVLEFVEAAGRILAITVRGCAPETRGFHPFGTSDPEGFAGMGCIEILLHGQDIAGGLGLALDPPRRVCEHVVTRMFPDIFAATGQDPWVTLLWATGRASIPGQSDVEKWAWHGAPLND